MKLLNWVGRMLKNLVWVSCPSLLFRQKKATPQDGFSAVVLNLSLLSNNVKSYDKIIIDGLVT